MIDSTKISVLFCLTIIVTSILVMSYNEYVNRFSIVTTQNNEIYIFDKKSAVLNKCENGQCILINTSFPQNPLLQTNNTQQQSQQYATNVTYQQNNNHDQTNSNNSNQQQSDNYTNSNDNQNNNNQDISNNQQNNNVPQVRIINTSTNS